jgi:hypothetical protein
MNKESNHMDTDGAKEYAKYSQLFKKLYENKVVYHERFSCIIKLEDIKITEERFEATAVPFLQIINGSKRLDKTYPDKPWEFGGIWKMIKTEENCLFSPYGGWSIWFEPELVKKVENLVLDGKYNEALKLTLYADKYEK